MASNSINLTTTTEGLAALQAMTISGTPLSITKIELSSNLTPNVDPNTWDPSGGAIYPNWYVQTTNVTSIKAGLGGSYVFDVQLNETIPLNKLYGATDPINTQNGWVGTPSTSINIGSFCLFITNPETLLTIPLMIGYFSTETVLKFSNQDYIAGNILDLLNQLYFTAFDSTGLTYVVNQQIDAQVSTELTINDLTTPTEITANIYNVTDIQGIAYTDYQKWYFTNYAILLEGATFSRASGNVFTSADLFNSLPVTLQNIGALPINMLIGEIYDSNGVMKQCFHIIETSVNDFTTGTTLPPFVTGDKLICFINENFQYFTPPVPPYVYPTINTYNATNIINTAMQLNGELVSLGDASAVQVGFDYKATYEANWTRTPLSTLTYPNTYSLIVGGLVSNQTYDIRAVAVDMTTLTNTYGAILTATTSLVPIPDVHAFFNITGATSGVSNTALDSTSIPIVNNGSIVSNQVVASADSCVSATFEIAQPVGDPAIIQIQPYYTLKPYVLTLATGSTATTLIFNDTQSGLLYDGVELILDDGGTMRLVTAGAVTQETNPLGGYIYTCTSLSSFLVNVPLWVAKGGQVYQSSCGVSSGYPVYINDTVYQMNRNGNVLVVTMAIRVTNGMFVQEQIIINKDDIVSQYGCNLWV